ncbi:hypothetical protein Emed_002192 [Eimeria media]
MSGVAPDEGAAASADQEEAGQRVDGEVAAADRGMSEADGRVGFAEGDAGGLSDGKDNMPDVDAGLGEEDAKTDREKASGNPRKDPSRRRKKPHLPDEGEEKVAHEGGGKEAGEQENGGSPRKGNRGSRKSTSASSSEKARKSGGSSIKKGRELGAPPFPMQQALLVIAVVIGLLLTSALRRGLSPPKRLPPEGAAPSLEGLPPQPAKPPKPAEPPVPRLRMPSWTLANKYSAQGIEDQRSTLASNLHELRQAWDSASEEVKKSFAARLEMGEEGSPGAQPDAQSPPEFETALAALLVPAAQAQETPTPAPVGERIVFGRTLALLNASLYTAQVKLGLLTELNKRKKEGWGAHRLPERRTPAKVSVEVFLRMLGEKGSTQVAGDEASKAPTISRGLAEDLARVVISSRLQTEAAKRIIAAFNDLWKDRESLSKPKELIIPGGGLFLEEQFLLLLSQYNVIITSIVVVVDSKVKRLVEAFTCENADDTVNATSDFLAEETSSFSRKLSAASEKAKQNNAGSLHQALLRLLE